MKAAAGTMRIITNTVDLWAQSTYVKERVLAYAEMRAKGREALRNKNDWNVETTKEHKKILGWMIAGSFMPQRTSAELNRRCLPLEYQA